MLETISAGLHVVAIEYSDIRRVAPLSWQVAERVSKALVPATACAGGCAAASEPRRT